MTYHYGKEFVRILLDASTHPTDREDVRLALQEMYDAEDPHKNLRVLLEASGLLEFVIDTPASGHQYGVIYNDLDHVIDGIAYWRIPPIYKDPNHPLPHGYNREHAIELAMQRKGKATDAQGT